MATNLDAMPYLGGASATRSQVARVKEIPLSAPWAQPPDRPCGIGDRCRAAMFGVYLRYKNIPEGTARHIFQKHEGGYAAAWLRVDAHERRMSEAATLARPGLKDRCLAAMFGLYLRCKGITEDTAREIFAGHVGSRRPCVLAWFKVHGRLNDGELAFGRMVPALWKQAQEWVAPYEWASHLRSAAIEKAMDATFRRVIGASDQIRRDAGGLERFATQALKEALREELTPHWGDWVSQVHDEELVTRWRNQFAQACVGAAWDDIEVRALIGLLPAEEQLKLRREITASAQKAGLRAAARLTTDPQRLAIQIVAGEVGIHPAFRTIPASASATIKRSRGGASGLAALGGIQASPWPPRQSDVERSGRGHKPEQGIASNSPGRLRTETAAESLDRSWRRLNQGLDPM